MTSLLEEAGIMDLMLSPLPSQRSYKHALLPCRLFTNIVECQPSVMCCNLRKDKVLGPMNYSNDSAAMLSS